MLEVIVPAARRSRSVFGSLMRGGRNPSKGPEQRSVAIVLTEGGVLEADVIADDGDDDETRGARPRLGLCGILLLLLLVVSSLLSAMPPALPEAAAVNTGSPATGGPTEPPRPHEGDAS